MNGKRVERGDLRGAGRMRVYLKNNWQLYALLALPLLYLLIFKYAPTIYIQIAFKKYKLKMSVSNLIMPLKEH